MLLDKVSDTSLADLFLGLGDFSISKKKKNISINVYFL